ncbi:hypothetical protein ACQ1ZK_16270, partial [Enterococcus faecium]
HEPAAIEHLKYISQNYHYEVDASHNVWGDSYKVFGEDIVLNTGDHAVVAGDDIKDTRVDNSDNSLDVDIKDSLNGSYNDKSDHSTTVGTVVGGSDNHAYVDNSQKYELD